jgi:hypothetical protein
MKAWKKLMIIALAMCLISMIAASLLQSAGGKIDISTIRVALADGKVVEALLFRPKTATAEHPAPLVITMHGSYNNKEMQDANTIELARRGVVVLNMDALGHGNSSIIPDPFVDYWKAMRPYADRSYIDPATAPGDGMPELLNYAYNSYNFIDKGKIGIMGHSMGAALSHSTVSHDIIRNFVGAGPRQVFAVLNVGSNLPMLDWGTAEGRFSPVIYYDPDNDKNNNNTVELPYSVNFGICAAAYDEFAFGFKDQPKAKNFYKSDSARSFINQLDNQNLSSGQDVELGKFYSGPIASNGNYTRVIYQPQECHPYQHFSKASTAATINFFSHVFNGLPNDFSEANQTWKIKEYFNCLGLIGFFVFVLAFAYMMLELPFFASLRAKGPVISAPVPKDIKAKVVYWAGLAVGAALPALLLFKIQTWVGAQGYFPLLPLYGNRIWPIPSPLEIGVWAAVVSILTCVVFFICRLVILGKEGRLFDIAGLKISAKNFFKTLLLASVTTAAAFFIVFLARYFFTTDFRIWTFAIKAFNVEKLIIALRYMLLFVIFYLGNSLVQNVGNCLEGQKEWLNILICAAGNIIGICIIEFIQYVSLFSRSVMPWYPMRVLNVWTLIPILVIATIISRKLYLKTGNVYLGAFINTMLFSIIPVVNTLAMSFEQWFPSKTFSVF